MSSFARRVILITGAGSGLGRQLALTLAREGAAIAGVDVKADGLRQLETELPAQFSWETADVSDRPALVQAAARLQERLGPIDVLIANAGVAIRMAAHQFSAAEVETHIRVNLIGTANSIEAVLPGMLARKSGHLVAISSLASLRGMPRLAAYSASKAGINALMDGLRVELKKYGIPVTIICPGFIRTPLTAQLADAHYPMLEADDAARRIVEAIRRRKKFYAFPANGAIQTRLLGMLPCGLSDWILVKRYRGLLDMFSDGDKTPVGND